MNIIFRIVAQIKNVYRIVSTCDDDDDDDMASVGTNEELVQKKIN